MKFYHKSFVYFVTMSSGKGQPKGVDALITKLPNWERASWVSSI